MTRFAMLLRATLFAVALFALAPVVAAQAKMGSLHADEVPPAARGLFVRLVAPCCWIEGLVSHDSPLANALRSEIVDRIRAGEEPSAIERDLIARHGERIRAAPTGLDQAAVGIAIAMAVALAALVGWTRSKRPVAIATPPATDDPMIERQLLDELARLED